MVSLERVEEGLKAVQRGTDRTAAELAVPRLTRELRQAQEDRALALKSHIADVQSAHSGRLLLSGLVFLVFVIGSVVIGRSLNSEFIGLLGVSFSIAAPIYVFKKTKLPVTRTAEIAREYDESIARIEQSLVANREILNAPL